MKRGQSFTREDLANWMLSLKWIAGGGSVHFKDDLGIVYVVKNPAETLYRFENEFDSNGFYIWHSEETFLRFGAHPELFLLL